MMMMMMNAAAGSTGPRFATTLIRRRAALAAAAGSAGKKTNRAPIRFKSASTKKDAAEASVEAAAADGAAASSGGTEQQQQQQAVPIAKTLGAAVLAVGTVSLVAAAVESASASSVPKYAPLGQRFDQSSFSGRFSRMILACDPRLLFYTKEQVEKSKEMLDNHQEYDGMDRSLWEARRVVEAALHPDTRDWIPRPFRMSGYVPFNGPVCVAMVASQSTPALLFWSWANQSQNALVNYYNRNASSPMTNETLAISYAAAVGSSLVVAFGLATAIQRKYPPAQAKQLLKWVAFPSAVVASSLNCYIVRSPEIKTGIPLTDEDGNDVLPGETSQEAGKMGVYSTTASRAMLQAPVYFVPPVLLSLGPIRRFITAKPELAVPLTTFLLLVSFGIGLPATVAVFPQIAEIPAEKVEFKYQHLRNHKTKELHQKYYYNKGL